MLYKGYVETKDKKCIEKFKGRTDFKNYDEVKALTEYAGILAEDTILIDIDDKEQSDILFRIVEDLEICCKVIKTTRGKHFLFKNTQITSCKTHVTLACGLTADIKVGYKNSYEILKVNGKERQVLWDIDEGEAYSEVPKWLFPVSRKNMEFLSMDNGSGRNNELFKYILTLQSNDFTVEECRTCIRLINKYMFKEQLDDAELETILRDEAFQKPVFFNGNVFLFDRFATYLKNTEHMIIMNNQLHIFDEGVYDSEPNKIRRAMIKYLPTLSDARRNEVFKYLLLICDKAEQADAKYIAFKNGILNIETMEMQAFSPEITITNKIPHNYNPSAYSELMDNTLSKLSCNDASIRSLLEECSGYCLFRKNERKKSFILTGSGDNGKSTFLDCIKQMLGEENISALDLKELGDRFNTSMIFGKLANIGDDISDDFLQGSQVAMFKKIVAGNRIKAERKGQDPFEFNPYVKLLFSANEIPRMRDKTGAVLSRLVIIPFGVKFSKKDNDYDPDIKYKLIQEDSIEYLIVLAVNALHKLITGKGDGFTTSEKVLHQLEEYEKENNPIAGFLEEHDEYDIINNSTTDVYAMYQVFCNEGNFTPMTKIVFSRQINERLKTEVVVKKINGKTTRVFVRNSANIKV